jgi:hypothetical protein
VQHFAAVHVREVVCHLIPTRWVGAVIKV